jgi:hypothetical protein
VSNKRVTRLRLILLAFGIAVAGIVAVALQGDLNPELPPIGPAVEPLCLETMRRSAPDLTWSVPPREQRVDRAVPTVTLGELPWHDRQLVRVAGVLHAEFEWVALYPSRDVIGFEEIGSGPWVDLYGLVPKPPDVWPAISDRCVVVEGSYSKGRSGHMGMFNGRLDDLVRLEVWSTPHRPFVYTIELPPPPPPPPSQRVYQ